MSNTVIFKPTYRCNLKCTYCYEKNNRDAEHPLEMTQEQAIEALENIIAIDPNESWEIIWHGGEPSILGLDYFKNVTQHFSDKPINWAFQSNGTLINDAWLDYFKKLQINIGSSWDGIDNNISRGSRNFFELMQRGKEKGVVVNAIFTMTPENSKRIIESYQFARDNEFNLIFNTAFGIGLTIEDHIELAKRMVELFDYICITETDDLDRPFDEILSYIEGKELFFCEGKNCVGHWYGIHPDGGVYSCGKPWSDETCMANVFTDKENLKQKIEQSEFRNILRNTRQQQLEDCKHCKYVITCRGKCPFTGFIGKEYHKDFAQCAYNKTFYDGCLKILKKHLREETLINNKIIFSIHASNKMEFKEWKNYKSPLI